MFKKVVSAIMVAAMVGTMVAPVSVSAKDGGKTIELWTCWTEGADTEKASQEMIQKWEEETGNTVNQTNFTYDMLHEKILTAAAGGNVPDLIWGLPEYVGEFYNMGIVADLTDKFNEWEDLLAQSDYYDNNGKYLTELACTGVRASQELLVYLAQYGLEIASAQDDGKYKNTWNENKDELEKATKVFQFYQDLIDNKIIDSSAKNWGWEETDENFATGITSTYVTGNWLAERESSNSDTMGDVSVAPIPYPADGQPATYMECKPMFIMEGSENKDEAFDLATAFCSKEWQEAAFADRSPRSDVSTDSKWSKDFSALADTGVTFPPVTLSGINQAMVDSIAKVLQEGKTAEEAASWLSDAVNASLQENGELSE